jgi:LuxR family maltose regulon positive regulatory protein
VAHGALADGDGGGGEYWAAIARPLIASGPQPAGDLPAALAMIDASLARDGTAGMAESAERALRSLDGDGPWASMADLMAGLAAHFVGDGAQARRRLSDAARRAAVWNIPLIQVLALAQLALLAATEGDWPAARILASQGRAQVEHSGLSARPSIALTVAVSAYVDASDRRREEAIADLQVARGLLDRLQDFGAWFEIETAASLAAAAAELHDPGTSRELIASARRRLGDVPDAPMLEGWVREIEGELAGLSESGLAELTPAEMRVLRLLPSHRSYPQIAAELYVSPNTVKSQVRSLFGKLGVSSRHEAVELCRPTSGSPHQGDSAPAPDG